MSAKEKSRLHWPQQIRRLQIISRILRKLSKRIKRKCLCFSAYSLQQFREGDVTSQLTSPYLDIEKDTGIDK